MARYNEILVGRYNRHFQKLLSMKGEPPAPQLSTEITPSIQLFSGVEERYTQGWETFGSSIGQAAVAAQTGGIRLRNPTASGVIAVFLKIAIRFDAIDQVLLEHGAATTDLTNIVALTSRNLDNRSRPQPSLIASSAAPAAGLNSLQSACGAVNTNYDYIWDEIQTIPLLPGDAIQVRSNVVNQAITACFWWRERGLEESERT